MQVGGGWGQLSGQGGEGLAVMAAMAQCESSYIMLSS